MQVSMTRIVKHTRPPSLPTGFGAILVACLTLTPAGCSGDRPQATGDAEAMRIVVVAPAGKSHEAGQLLGRDLDEVIRWGPGLQ